MTTSLRYRATGLEEVLREQGRRREWIAAQAGVHASLITHAIAGRRTVGDDVAKRISAALGVPLFLLFELSSVSEMMPDRQQVA